MNLYTQFKTEDPGNHTLLSGTYPFRPNKGVPTPGLLYKQTPGILDDVLAGFTSRAGECHLACLYIGNTVICTCQPSINLTLVKRFC